MGTINYNSNNYITLSIKPYEVESIINDKDFISWCNENDIEDIENAAYDAISNYYEADRENAETIINKYAPYYYHFSIEPGYYEGLYIDIENNFPIAFNDYIEKKEAGKEITHIKQMLIELAGCGFVSTSCGWCMGYRNYSETLKDIKEAVKVMRAEVSTTPTWRDYEADRHYKHM